jgi:hypothetical protein
VNTATLRRRFILPRPTAWRCFVVLLMFTLGTEYWNKNALDLPGIQVPWPHFMVALLLLPLLLPVRDRRWSTVLCLPAPLAPMLVFWAACFLSIVSVALSPASAPVPFLKTFVHLSLYVVFVCVVVKWITWPRLWLLVRSYYALGVVAALLSILQMLHGGLGLFPWLAPLRFQSSEYALGEGLTTGFRTSSFFGEPSWAARYFVHYIALALAFWVQTRRRRHLVALVLFTVAFYAANSLLGYVILGTLLLTAAIAQMWRRSMFTLGRRQKVAIGVGAYVFLMLWLFDATPEWPDLIDRSIARLGLVAKGAGAVGNRIDSVFAGIEVWKLAPVFGVGLGNIDRYIVPFYQDPEWVLRSQHASDSLYVQILAETGIPGLLAFLWFWGRLLWFSSFGSSNRAAHPEAARAYGWMRFLQLDLFAQAVGMINASDYMNPHLWTVIAIVLACKVFIIRDTHAETDPSPVRAGSGAPVPSLAF